MGLFIEIHIIQNFAPSNLNRDDTGAPKDALFGGFRRARVSSQCLKKAARDMARNMALLPPERMGLRTKKLADAVIAHLPEDRRSDEEERDEALARVTALFSCVKIALDRKGRSKYLIFLGANEIKALAGIVDEQWDALASKAALPKEVEKRVRKALDGGKAVDVALFGRMLADLPEKNTGAACQVAHAISTHKVDREFDYFTAMDDLAARDEPGAAMIETIEFNSACLYRYAAVDWKKLVENLEGDRELALAGLETFLRAMVLAIPTGKQNAFAAHSPPEFVGVVLRRAAPRSLVNAFQTPIRPCADASLAKLSVQALARYEEKLCAAYGAGEWAWFDLTDGCPEGLGVRVFSLDALTGWLADREF